MIRFFNTLKGAIEPFQPLEEERIRLYTCGPTVYDYAHIGNFRAYMFEDLLKRFLLFMGYKVLHVMNITDIDDKTIKGARDKGISLDAYTREYIDAFYADMGTLNILKADHYPRATKHIPEMTKIIRGLLEKGYAYKKDGSVYFDLSKFPDYGKLSKIDRDHLRMGQRSESDEYAKADPVDFALWKGRKEGEPFWETEFGPGRPGWHIECSAMSAKYLGIPFDIHCGGVDNIFPHHENEIAQSEAYSGQKFVNFWLHCHHLIVDGEKMSKSRGNFYLLKDVLEKGASPAAMRFLLLSTHYRKQLNFTFDALEQASSSCRRISDFLYELDHRPFDEGENPEAFKLAENMLKSFQSGLSDDLNVSVALTSLFDMIKKAHILLAKGEILSQDRLRLKMAVEEVNKVIGVLPEEKMSELPSDILDRIKQRERARMEKDFSLADRIRDELLAMGIVLEDTKEGVRWKKRS